MTNKEYNNYNVVQTKNYKKGVKELVKKHKTSALKELKTIIKKLCNHEITTQYSNHRLTGVDAYELHVDNEGEILLVYRYEDKALIIELQLIDLTNHRDLKNKKHIKQIKKDINKLKEGMNKNTLKSNVDKIDDLIEDIYDLRKRGMARNGEMDIFNLIFKEFRNLGYLDNLKELRKKEISKKLSLEQLNEDISSIQKLSTKDIAILCKIINELSYYNYDYVVSALTILDDIRNETEEIYSTIHSVVLKWTAEDFVTFCIWKRDKLKIFDFFSLYKNKYEEDEYFFVDFDSILEYLMVSAEGDIGEIYNIVTETSMGEKSLDDYAKNLYKYDYKTRKFNNKSLYDEINSEITQHLKK